MSFLLTLLAVDCSSIPDDYIPIILVHGLTKDRGDMYKLRDLISQEFPNRKLFCPNILLGVMSSIFESQTRYARALASEINDFLLDEAPDALCVDLIGHSQGGFYSRIYTYLYSGQYAKYSRYVKVRRLYSLAGVMGGFFCEQKCGPLEGQSPLLKVFVWFSQPKIVYSRFATMLFTPVSEWKDVWLSKYYAAANTLLCIANKECPSQYDVRKEFSELYLMVNFWSLDDEVISPPDSEIFNFYKQGSKEQIEDVQETAIFSSIGLDVLKQAGRWKRVLVPGFKHRSFIDNNVEWFYRNCLRKYLVDDFDLTQSFETVCE